MAPFAVKCVSSRRGVKALSEFWESARLRCSLHPRWCACRLRVEPEG